MYIVANKVTGKVVGLTNNTYQLDDFTFNDLDDCIDYMHEDDNLHAEDMLVFKVDEAYKPVIGFDLVEDYID